VVVTDEVLELAQHWPLIAARMTAGTSERQLAMLAEVVVHADGEYTGDTPAVMGTLVDEPVYHYWGLAPSVAPQGRGGVEQSYVNSSRTDRDFDIDVLVVDDDHVVTEGTLRTAVSARRVEAMGADTGGEQLDPDRDFDIDVLVVDDDHVVTEGTLRTAVSARRVEAMGADTGGERLDPDRRYVVEMRMVVVWPFSPDGKLLGEDIYFGTSPTVVRPLGEGEVLYPRRARA